MSQTRRYKQPISVLVVIYCPDGKILLLERRQDAGDWQSVTGSREGEENLSETACREVGEETGLIFLPSAFCNWHQQCRYEIFAKWRRRYAPQVTENVEHWFSLALSQPSHVVINPAEHRRWRWLPWREAVTLCFSPSNRDAILHLAKREGWC